MSGQWCKPQCSGGLTFGSAAACQWNTTCRWARQGGLRRIGCPVQFTSISASIAVCFPGLLCFFGFLMCSCPCPVRSLSKLYLPLRQPRLFDLSKFIPILSAVCFSAFPDFFPSRSMACQILETTMGSRVFGGRYYDATAASSGLHGVAVLGHSQQFRIFAAPRQGQKKLCTMS